MRRCAAAIVGLSIAISLLPRLSSAQYTADFQTNIISGVTSNWIGDYYVGNTNFGGALLIQNAGVLTNSGGYIGYDMVASNNSVVVSGIGSVWSNRGTFSVGYSGAANTLIISNRGKVFVSPTSSYPFVTIGRNNTANNNEVLVSGSGSSWSFPMYLLIGYFGSGNRLTISNGGTVLIGGGALGGNSASKSNVVIVTGNGSLWKLLERLELGPGVENQLIISDGGAVVSTSSHSDIGVLSGGSNNLAIVTGITSIWSNRDLRVFGQANQLIITNGGRVYSSLFGALGGSRNFVQVTGTSSFWQNVTLYLGSMGGISNQLCISDGGVVAANNAYVGSSPTAVDNQIQITGGNFYVTNVTHNALLEVHCGTLSFNSGVLQADILIITNACGRLIHTGGALLVGTTNISANLDADDDGIPNAFDLNPFNPADASADNDGDGSSNLHEYLAGTDPTNSASAFRITSIVRTNNDIRVDWMSGTGKTNALERTAGTANGSYSNNFVAIFTVTNTVGTTTNYLDLGAATNSPARYYRVRLVP